MDIVSHGLWGSLAFGRSTRKSFWLAFFFGIAPDLFSFGTYMAAAFLGLNSHADWKSGEPPDPSQIPIYVHNLYDLTHSLIVFAAVFALVWWFRKKPLYELAAWGLHILVDIPTHAYIFFPTPFLWPLSDLRIDGIPWSHPIIFIPNVTLLLVSYYWFFIRPRFTVKE
ncbi:MAG: hypothetical protein A3E38_00860 [Candidatus Moranbacteria bacterium RIFCSPHIGHO2_12_FULL_54_9]|nr:MAG: hypothetical protein A2878_03270 [Candidatus Moranbacteria bacterium RIFCSPHIGHO2_01_FULL_54_31]OGI26101.1 MAG: hypothetical protein A3E38_00860 [Candidatus Moranbacteria bacterium RIFCSPHIGHO2_12_FULL_54_9]